MSMTFRIGRLLLGFDVCWKRYAFWFRVWNDVHSFAN